MQKGLGTVEKADKPAAGKRFNEVKEALETAFTAAELRLKQAQSSAGRGSHAGGPLFDPTLPGRGRRWAICTRSRRRSKI